MDSKALENFTDSPGVGAKLVRILLALVLGVLSYSFWWANQWSSIPILLRLFFCGASSILLANLYWLVHPTLLRKQVWAGVTGFFLLLNLVYSSLFYHVQMSIYGGLFLVIPTTLSLGYGAYISSFAPPKPSPHQKVYLLATAWFCSLLLLRRASGPGWFQDQMIHWAPATALSSLALLATLLKSVWGESKWTEISTDLSIKFLFLFASLSILYGFETLSPHDCISPYSVINDWLFVLIPAGLAQFSECDEGIGKLETNGPPEETTSH